MKLSIAEQKQTSYKGTLTACFLGYIVQSVVNTFAPLLFLTFQGEYGIPLAKITALATINFFLQLCTDISSAFLIKKIGYRACAVLANFCAAAGLIMLTFMPSLLSNAFAGLLISVIVYAIGGGLMEVVVSPIVEACPGDHKSRTMSLLHSFYCWGSVAVIGLSTLYFSIVGTENWRILSIVWAIIPIVDLILFLVVPILSLDEENDNPVSASSLLKNKSFWLFFLVILGAGAAEAAIVQWSSAFAEKGLGVSKTVGDLTGPALFSVCMGCSRLLYGKFGDKLDLKKAMTFSGFLCVLSYLIMTLSPSAVFSLVGMALCGFSVGILWPGSYSMASAEIKGGGTMFAMLALGGDIGCTVGPTVVGLVSDAFNENFKIGILFATIFPLILTILMFFSRKYKKAPKTTSGTNATNDENQENEEINTP